MRIVSLLPSATEIVCALGLERDLVGVSHTCDYPAEVAGKPVVTRSLRAEARRQGRAVDAALAEAREQGAPYYLIDAALLKELRPDVILTQEICDVCAVDGRSVFAVAAKSLSYGPRIVSVNAARLADILRNVLDIGEAVGQGVRAERLAAQMRQRLERVDARMSASGRRPRVASIEWVRTLRNAGLWMPEIIALAGGVDVLGVAGERSRVVTPEAVAGCEPEVALVMPCGMDLEASVGEAQCFAHIPGVASVPAVRAGRVYAIDGRVPSRHGPRIVDVAETVAALLHPELGLEPGPQAGWAWVSV